VKIAPKAPVVALKGVSKDFAKPSGEPLTVLADINVSLREGEILGLLGRSGSGKSTLLRIAAGLIQPSAGTVTYRDTVLKGPTDGIAVVFQTFALFPWLTVIENVEAGLDALGLDHKEARRRALASIELIGLDGFQEAYPRELSGGMRQRVGFARALVIDPTVLLMDEPFSALDVLTAETLRTDFLDLWTSHRLPTKSVLLVTHNIEEAVLMCDRILVLAPNPGRISAEIEVDLPHPAIALIPPSGTSSMSSMQPWFPVRSPQSARIRPCTVVSCSPCRAPPLVELAGLLKLSQGRLATGMPNSRDSRTRLISSSMNFSPQRRRFTFLNSRN
jgi:NitT/TauT family transport system ATP-binding protein